MTEPNELLSNKIRYEVRQLELERDRQAKTIRQLSREAAEQRHDKGQLREHLDNADARIVDLEAALDNLLGVIDLHRPLSVALDDAYVQAQATLDATQEATDD